MLDTIDATIERTGAVIVKLKHMRAGLLHDLLTRGLDDNGELREPDKHPDHFYDSPMGRIPKRWSIKSLEQIADPNAPICYGIVQVFGNVTDGVPVLAIRDILGDFRTGIHRTARDIDAAYTRSRVRPGDVLISIKGTIGRIGVVPEHFEGNISRDLARVRPAEEIVPQFLCHLLRSTHGRRTLALAQVGTTRGELSIAPLKKLLFATPLWEEQVEVAKRIDAHEATIALHDSELSKLMNLKLGLMSDLMTGRVPVPETITSGAAQ